MTFNQAYAKAARIARKTQSFRAIVIEDGEYAVASDYDLETFFYGAQVIAYLGPDGMPA